MQNRRNSIANALEISLIEAEWCMYVSIINYINIGSDNGLLHGWRQALIWMNVGLLLTATLGTNFGEILIEIQTFSFKKIWIWKYRLENGGHFVSVLMC